MAHKFWPLLRKKIQIWKWMPIENLKQIFNKFLPMSLSVLMFLSLCMFSHCVWEMNFNQMRQFIRWSKERRLVIHTKWFSRQMTFYSFPHKVTEYKGKILKLAPGYVNVTPTSKLGINVYKQQNKPNISRSSKPNILQIPGNDPVSGTNITASKHGNRSYQNWKTMKSGPNLWWQGMNWRIEREKQLFPHPLVVHMR